MLIIIVAGKAEISECLQKRKFDTSNNTSSLHNPT